MNEPDEILHIALPDEWADARPSGEYRRSTRGRSLDDDGFIHCAYLRQVEGVANRYYADQTELILLHLDLDLVEGELRVEPAAHNSDEMFPHLYGPIPTAAVVATTWWDRGDDGLWHKPVIM